MCERQQNAVATHSACLCFRAPSGTCLVTTQLLNSNTKWLFASLKLII